jgi:hypothetical protein
MHLGAATPNGQGVSGVASMVTAALSQSRNDLRLLTKEMDKNSS